MRKWIGVVLIMFFMTGCVQNDEQTDAKTIITVKPVDLYKGESAKFKPFMGTMSGAIKLGYMGKKPNASLDLEIWQKGKPAESVGSIGDLYFSSEDADKNREIEVIIALEDDVDGQKMRVKLGTFYDSGNSVSTFTIPLEIKLMARGVLNDSEPRSFASEDNAADPVWAMYATSSNVIRTADLTLEALKEQEWALVVLYRSTN